MARPTILLVQDDPSIRELLQCHLEKEAFRPILLPSGENAMMAARSNVCSLVLLDWHLPSVDGLAICRSIRADEKARDIPIIMLTERSDEADVESALMAGADDYVTRPFSPRILIARIRAVLRRYDTARRASQNEGRNQEGLIEHEGLAIYENRYDATYRGRQLDLTRMELQVLTLLAKKPGWVFSRQEIIESIHGSDYVVTERAVDVLIVALRRKLGKASALIETVRGIGYRMASRLAFTES